MRTVIFFAINEKLRNMYVYSIGKPKFVFLIDNLLDLLFVSISFFSEPSQKSNWKKVKICKKKSNKTGTSKVGAISKAQKAQVFFGKKLEIFEFFFLSENVA